MEGHDYEQMVKEMREKCATVYTKVKDLYELTPPSLKHHLKGYADTLKWEFKLPDDEKSKPYLVWSLGPDFLEQLDPNWFGYLVTLCYGRGEFGFYPYHEHPIRIFRRTPRGWGRQEELLVDELCSVAKHAPECDISSVLGKIAGTFSDVPWGLKTLIQKKVSELGNDAGFLFAHAVNWNNSARWGDQNKKAVETSIRKVLGELRAIEQNLEDTKSIAKSKVLRAIRERCHRLGYTVEGLLPEHQYYD